MKSLTINLPDRDYDRLMAGVAAKENRVYDTPEQLAALAVETGLCYLEKIEFNVIGFLLCEVPQPAEKEAA